MLIGKVNGNLVSTKKDERLTGCRFLICDICTKDGNNLTLTGHQLVVVDAIGAGRGEIVLISCGSSARRALNKPDLPVDATIIGIVDDVIE